MGPRSPRLRGKNYSKSKEIWLIALAAKPMLRAMSRQAI
jgi:hypothetical protein